MGVNAEKTKKNRFFRVTLWVRRQTAKLASGSAPSCGDTILPTFLNFFIYFSIENGLYTQIWMFFSIFFAAFKLIWPSTALHIKFLITKRA